MNEMEAAVKTFVDGWVESPDGNKQGFVRLHDVLAGKGDKVALSFHPRPGVTYSLRGAVPGNERSLFVMVDVIDDQPRWLSVCFFADMITDPEKQGAFVPGGLQGEDALCFDLDACTEAALAYVVQRVDEAFRAAGGV